MSFLQHFFEGIEKKLQNERMNPEGVLCRTRGDITHSKKEKQNGENSHFANCYNISIYKRSDYACFIEALIMFWVISSLFAVRIFLHSLFNSKNLKFIN